MEVSPIKNFRPYWALRGLKTEKLITTDCYWVSEDSFRENSEGYRSEKTRSTGQIEDGDCRGSQETPGTDGNG
jgi:hypothetical protein